MKNTLLIIIGGILFSAISVSAYNGILTGTKPILTGTTPVVIPATQWSGMGMNYGHHFGTYVEADVDADLIFLKNSGVTKIRIAFPMYNSVTAKASVRSAALRSVNAGLYTIYGVTAGNPITPTSWTDFKAQVLLEADWAAANGINEFSVGNEEELHNDDVSPTDATIRSDLKTLATTIKASHPTLTISYQADQTQVAAWNTLTLGSIDKIGFNIYSNFDTISASIVTDFGSAGYISEWNASGTGCSTYATENECATQLWKNYRSIRNSGISSAYFFTYRDGSFGLGSQVDWWALYASTGLRTKMAAVMGIYK